MDISGNPIPVRPLYVEIDGLGRCRQAFSIDDLAALLCDSWRRDERSSSGFHRALATSLDAMELYLDHEVAREAFVNAAHAAGIHVLPDDLSEMRKAS